MESLRFSQSLLFIPKEPRGPVLPPPKHPVISSIDPRSRGRGAVAHSTVGEQQTQRTELYGYPEVCPRDIYSCLNQNSVHTL